MCRYNEACYETTTTNVLFRKFFVLDEREENLGPTIRIVKVGKPEIG